MAHCVAGHDGDSMIKLYPEQLVYICVYAIPRMSLFEVDCESNTYCVMRHFLHVLMSCNY